MAAKAYRLLRAIMTTAVEEGTILPCNPCRVRGAGEEHASERPVLTITQVFDLAEPSDVVEGVGRRELGRIAHGLADDVDTATARRSSTALISTR